MALSKKGCSILPKKSKASIQLPRHWEAKSRHRVCCQKIEGAEKSAAKKMFQKSLVGLYFEWNLSANKNNQEQWQQTLFSLVVVLIEVFGSMMMRHELKDSWSISRGMSLVLGFHRKVSSSLKHSRHVWEYSIPAARTIYFMGIIDILTPYDEMKKFEHRFKACVILVWQMVLCAAFLWSMGCCCTAN